MLTLGDILERNARYYPDQIALIYENRRVTYAQLADIGHRLASALHRAGVGKQDRISMLAMNCDTYIEWYAACELSGIVAAPVNFRLAAPEIEYILKDCTPKVLFFEAQYMEMIGAMRARLESIHLYVCIDDPSPPSWAMRYEDFLATGSPEGAPFRAGLDDILHLVYTSGTTGRPKGAMRSHRADAAMAAAMATQLGTSLNTRILLMMPFFHIGARSMSMPTYWMAGTVVVQRKFDPLEISRTIERERITHTHMAPTMVQTFLDAPGIIDHDLSSLKLCLYAAAPMPVTVLRRAMELLGPIFGNGYGMTEGNCTCLYPAQHHLDGTPEQQNWLNSVGQPLPTGIMRIVDEQGLDCPTDEPGEIWLKSTTLFSGYWNNHAATIDAFHDGWYKTGDMGKMDAHGFIYLVDRKKDMIITGGENVYCREVEEALMQHAAVKDVAVVGVPDEKWGESVKAVVVRKDQANATEQDLIEHCRALLARYKCPKSVDFVDELPRLPSGKIHKVTLRARYRQAG